MLPLSVMLQHIEHIGYQGSSKDIPVLGQRILDSHCPSEFMVFRQQQFVIACGEL